MNIGIHHDIPAADYHAVRAVSASGLKVFERTPAHYQHWLTNPTEPTPAMRIGTLTHMAVFEPHRFRASTAVAPIVDRRTKEGKSIWEQFQAQNAGKEIITADEAQQLEEMRVAVRAHPAAYKLLERGNPEVSMFAKDDDTGIEVKCRCDWLTETSIVDLKTTEDASPVGFARSIVNYRYHIQAAHYRSLAAALGLGQLPFIFIAVEKEPPHAVAVYTLDGADLIFAEQQHRIALRRFQACQDFNAWPAYSRDVQTISLPKWAANLNQAA
jgi:exodeoxyribonuclease VIII